jgi:hypothetical protein
MSNKHFYNSFWVDNKLVAADPNGWQGDFLFALAETAGSVHQTPTAAGVSRQSAYRRATDPAFAAAIATILARD